MNSSISDTSVVSRDDDWLAAWVGQEHVMMSAETGTCISLSETGGRIWELMEQPRSVRDLCRDLAAEYEADPALLHDDVLEFLGQLQKEQAIQIA